MCTMCSHLRIKTGGRVQAQGGKVGRPIKKMEQLQEVGRKVDKKKKEV